MLKTQARRLQKLVLLLNPGEARTKAALARALSDEVAPRTIQRDLEELQRLGAPIIYSGRLGVRFTHAWFLPVLAELGSDETLAGLAAHKLFAANLPPGLQLDLDKVSQMQRAAGMMNPDDDDFLQSLSRHGTCQVEIVSADAYDTVVQACRQRFVLAGVYENGRGESGSRQLEVHALFYHIDAWYTHAREVPEGHWKSFALHRFSSARLLRNRRFERDSAAVAAVREGRIFQQEWLRDVRLRLSPVWERHICERQWFPGQSYTLDSQGRREMHIPEAPLYPVLRFLFSFMGEVSVLSPDILKQEVQKKLSLMNEQATSEVQDV